LNTPNPIKNNLMLSSHSRRHFLASATSGLGLPALTTMLANGAAMGGEMPGSAGAATNGVTSKVKTVIWLFMNGGPSGIDLFDPKHELTKRHGQLFPGKIKTLFGFPGPLMGSPFRFSKHGQSGATVSHVLPHIAKHVDDITFLNACVSDQQNHTPACFLMNTGNSQAGSPNLGSWASYGLGKESDNLPTFIVMYDQQNKPEGASEKWSSGFLPGKYQGVPFGSGKHPILYLERPEGVTDRTQKNQLKLLHRLNERHLITHQGFTDLEARIRSFHNAYQMQTSVPELASLDDESAETLSLYGLDDKKCKRFGRQCLMARRMAEKGVPFVQIYHGGADTDWDHHMGLACNLEKNCRETDKPVAGLLSDLKRRGLFDSTLVIWGGEFGRGPTSQNGDGRDHNPYGFTMWVAGGGIKRGFRYGETDEFGYLPIANPVTTHDLHATVLHQMGIDETKLTFRYDGRDQTPTNGLGHVIKEILA